MLHVDEIIGAIGIDGRSAPTGGPARGGIDGRDEFRLDRGSGPESDIVQSSEIFDHGPVGLRTELVGRRDPALAMSVRHDHAGVDCKTLATDQALGHAAPYYRLEQLA